MPRSIHSADYKKLTAVIISLRKKAGLTQQQVADRLKRPQSYIAKVEGGERRLDVVEFIELIRAMDGNPAEIMKEVAS
ncbi:MAG: helix-turn-helix domain-containing protein [Rhizobiaceae bacterium]